MELLDELLITLREHPGITKSQLCNQFQLNSFKLNRALRTIERDLDGIGIIRSEDHGVWVIHFNTKLCMGVVWEGESDGRFCQCMHKPAFVDNRCYEHTDYESPEMVAFERELKYLTAVAEPNVFFVSQLNLDEVEELINELKRIVPKSHKEEIKQKKLYFMLRAAQARLKWKERSRKRVFDSWIPDDMWERHRRSTFNPFEATLKKYFVILEVTAQSSRDEVLKAWKRLARKYHPDKENGNEELMKQINSAKERIFKIRHWD